MAVRVKIPTVKLLEQLCVLRDKNERQYEKALTKWEEKHANARSDIANELIDLHASVADGRVHVQNETAYVDGDGRRRDREVHGVFVQCKTRLPDKPELPLEQREIKFAIALLEKTSDETVSVSTDEIRYYGIGSLAGVD